MTRVTTQLSCLLSAPGPTTPLLPLLCKNIKDDATYRGAESAMGLFFPSKPPTSSFPPAPQDFAEQRLHTCVWEDLWGFQGLGTWKKAMQSVGILNLGGGGWECTQSSSISWVSFVPENSLRKQSQLLKRPDPLGPGGQTRGKRKKEASLYPLFPKLHWQQDHDPW